MNNRSFAPTNALTRAARPDEAYISFIELDRIEQLEDVPPGLPRVDYVAR